MHKRVRYLVALILMAEAITIILAPALQATAAQMVQVGVSAKDYFVYGRSDGKPWIWRIPSQTPLLEKWNNFVNMSTITFRITGTQFPGQYDVTFNQTNTYENGSVKQLPSPQGVNLNSAVGGGFLFFISAGLVAGNMLYPNPYNANYTRWTINDTRVDPNWGGRTICFFNLTRIGATQGMDQAFKTIIVWDQQTGALLSVYDAQAAGMQNAGVIESGVYYELISTNRFSIQHSGGGTDMTAIYAIVAAGLVITVVVLAVRLATSTPKKKWKRVKE